MVIDILTRVDTICQKDDKYDAEKLNGAGGDPFARLYGFVDAEISQCIEIAEATRQEKNRVAVIALNAEIRRTSSSLQFVGEASKRARCPGGRAARRRRR